MTMQMSGKHQIFREIEKVMLEMKKSAFESLKKLENIDLHLSNLPTESESGHPIGAVDGSNNEQNLIGTTIVLATAVSGYYPSKTVTPAQKEYPHVMAVSLERRKIRFLTNIVRDTLEFTAALELTRHENIKAIILDGSLIFYLRRPDFHDEKSRSGSFNSFFRSHQPELDFIHPIAENEDDTSITKYYKKIYNYFTALNTLIRTCFQKKIALVAISKDTRNDTLVQKYVDAAKKLSLTDISYFELKFPRQVGYLEPYIDSTPRYSKYLKYTDAYVTYVRLTEKGPPLRVELLIEQKELFNEVLQILVDYRNKQGYLFPLTLVHNQAVLSNNYTRSVVDIIRRKFLKENPSIFNAILRDPGRRVLG